MSPWLFWTLMVVLLTAIFVITPHDSDPTARYVAYLGLWAAVAVVLRIGRRFT